jgi:hypothetical protein
VNLTWGAVETWLVSGPKTRELAMNLKKICDASQGSMNYRLGKFIGVRATLLT